MESLFALVCILASLFIALVLVTVVGHGIWMLLASLFSSPNTARTEERRERRSVPRVACVGCGEKWIPLEGKSCRNCGLDPQGKAADELRDLEATVRIMQRLLERGKLSQELCEPVYRSIESRQHELLRQTRSRPQFDTSAVADTDALRKLEDWFGMDYGHALAAQEKMQALALARCLVRQDLECLSPRALVGMARLYDSLGMLSRACALYQVLLESHARSAIFRAAAAEALRCACKLEDWQRADALVSSVLLQPELIAQQPELAALIRQVQERKAQVPAESAAAAAPSASGEPEGAAVASLEQRTSRKVPRDPPVPLAQHAIPVVVPVESAAAVALAAPEALAALAALAAPEAPEASRAQAARRRSFAEWIAVFMEESNILWGELIGGTLIVGCSIALVISLWQTLGDIPFFPFLLFAAITSALFGAGFYTLHHWKLESTSRGLLVIGTLLVPLDFLVLSVLSRGEGAGILEYVAEIAALVIFGALVERAARILVQAPLNLPMPSAWLLALTMLASAAAQLAAQHWWGPDREGLFLQASWSLLPALAQLGALGWMLHALGRLESWSLGRLVALLLTLGSATFACSVTLCFLLYLADDPAQVLPTLAPALTLLGVPMLLTGILMNQKLAPGEKSGSSAAQTPAEAAQQHALWRTLGTGLALLALLVMFGGLAMAMREPALRGLCGVLNFGILVAAAWVLRVPALHVPAQVALVVLVVAGGSSLTDDLLLRPEAALRLAGLLSVQALLAEAWIRLRRPADARFYALGSGVSTGLALIWIVLCGRTQPDLAAIVGMVAALTWLGANLRWRVAEITYAAAVVLAGSIFLGFGHFAPEIPLAQQLLWSLLIHATASLLAAALLRPAPALRDFLRIPLHNASLGAMFLAAGLLILEQTAGTLAWTPTSAACGWLAILWLVVAVLDIAPVFFGACQVALSCAWFYGASAWLRSRGWDWLEPYSLHVDALGLALMSLAWEGLRLPARTPGRLRALLTPAWVPVDRILTGVLVVGQYGLMVALTLFGAARELSTAPDEWRIFPAVSYAHAYALSAWLLPVVLAGVLLTASRAPGRRVLWLGGMVLWLTVPLLAAGTWFDSERAAASALRWGLALSYGLGSLLLWLRRPGNGEPAIPASPLTLRAELRGLLNCAALGPVLLISAIVVLKKLTHRELPGPLDGSLFRTLGGPVSLLVPLGLLSAALAGHGIRERLARYLLAAGWLALFGAVGGYFLALQRLAFEREPAVIFVQVLLLASGMAWLWALLWTGLASWLENEEARPLLDSGLLTLHGAAAAVLYAIALVPALSWLLLGQDDPDRRWPEAIGSVWGWLGFGLMASGSGFLLWQRGRVLALHLAGALSLTAVGLAACTVERFWPAQGSLALMLGAGGYACVWVWINLLFDPALAPRWLYVSRQQGESVFYASIACSMALFLGSASLVHDQHSVWSAVAIVLAGTACALLAYQRKTELWASLAAAALVLAGVLLVLHFDQENPSLWLRVVQTILALLGGTALLRLGLQPFIALPEVLRPPQVQLAGQLALGMLGNGLLLIIPALQVILLPNQAVAWLPPFGDAVGWLALLLNAVAVLWYWIRVRPSVVVHHMAAAGLLAGVVAACSAHFWMAQEPSWLASQVLILSWTVLALLLMTLAWVSHAQTALGPQFWTAERRRRLALSLRDGFPASAARAWVTGCGVLVVLLALRAAWAEPERPFLAAGNILAISALWGMLAIWSHAPRYVYGSGLLFNVIGFLLYHAWSLERIHQRGPLLAGVEWDSYFVLAQVFSFAAAAIVWSLSEYALRRRSIVLAWGALPFSQAALLASLHLLALIVGLVSTLHLGGMEMHVNLLLAWAALALLAGTTLLEVWRPTLQRFTLLQLYTCGLLALGLWLLGCRLDPPHWYWTATLFLAGYVLILVVILAWTPLGAWMQASAQAGAAWFWQVQLGTIGLVLLGSLWITLSFAQWYERLGGALASALATGAAFLLVRAWPRLFPRLEDAAAVQAPRGLYDPVLPSFLVLTLGVLTVLEICWACLDPDLPALWLQRSAVLFVVLAAAAVLGRFVLPRLLAPSPWTRSAQALSAVLAPASALVLLVLFCQELGAYREDLRTTPLRWELVAGAGLALVGLIGLALFSALTPEADRYGIEKRRRSLYVYAAELLLLLFLAHVRLNIPDLIPPILGQYWFLGVQVLAFALLGLSEIGARKGLGVLAAPLKRTAIVLVLLPVLAFWLRSLGELRAQLGAMVSGLRPFLRYLDRLSENYDYRMEVLCWLLVAVFLGWLARLRRSVNEGLLAALALNFALWVLLGHQDATSFLERPQLWLIPLGLIILVAEHLHRARLGFWPSLSIRYVGLWCIYLSSTIEMFRKGLDHSILLPLVLALLAVAGMLLGILLRVRAFLVAGFLALLVVVLAQIWNAAVGHGHTWVWWVCGILLGVAILSLFALFEKHRNEVLKMLDHMKRWN